MTQRRKGTLTVVVVAVVLLTAAVCDWATRSAPLAGALLPAVRSAGFQPAVLRSPASPKIRRQDPGATPDEEIAGNITQMAQDTAARQAHAAAMLGFSASAAEAERQIEEAYKAIPSAEEARKQHRFLTAEPHQAGTERNNELARYIAELWKQQGWEDVVLHRYDVLNSTPREVSLEMLSPIHYRPTLREDPYDVDPDTKNPRVRSGYLGFSTSGEITAPVVYAHSGNPEDYEVLRRNGVDVKGKIVLVR